MAGKGILRIPGSRLCERSARRRSELAVHLLFVSLAVSSASDESTTMGVEFRMIDLQYENLVLAYFSASIPPMPSNRQYLLE